MHEDFAIFIEDFLDFLNDLEASIQRLKLQIAKLVGVAEQNDDCRQRKREGVS
jgi:hypothetical protein